MDDYDDVNKLRRENHSFKGIETPGTMVFCDLLRRESPIGHIFIVIYYRIIYNDYRDLLYINRTT